MTEQVPTLFGDWGVLVTAALGQVPAQTWLFLGALAVLGALAPAGRGRRWRGRRRRW